MRSISLRERFEHEIPVNCNDAPPEATVMDLDSLWVLISAFLVLIMQGGFLCLESGLVRERHAEAVALKNVADWVLSNLLFFAVGFGLMFGQSHAGLFGTSLFALADLDRITGPIPSNETFFLFQLVFAGTAATIVSGAIAGRASFVAYLGSTTVMALLVYPVFGHWAWGNLLDASNEPWLASIGFIDFAGSTVVHSTGAWFALAAAWMIGPRQGRYDVEGRVRPMPPHGIQTAALGVLLLWLGWWGFNGGSALAFDASVGHIILNTNLAGAAAAFVSLVHGWARQDGRDLGMKLLGGAVGGLVSITASCHLASPMEAILIGAVGGWVHNVFFEVLLYRARIDDPVGAVAVHGFCGVWGTLAVAGVGSVDELVAGGRLAQLAVQLTGVLVCAAWSGGVAILALSLIRRTIGLRLSPEQELHGVDVSGRRRPTEPAVEPSPELDAETLRALMGSD